MDKLYIKALDLNTEVYSERLVTRITPSMKAKIEEISLQTNRNEADIVRLVLDWTLERVEIAFEELEIE